MMVQVSTGSDNEDRNLDKKGKASSKAPQSGKVRRYGLPEEEFKLLKERYATATPETKKIVINSIASALYEDIYRAAKKKIGGDKKISVTSVTILTYMKMLGYFSERGGDLGKYGTVGELMLLFQRGVHQVVVDKYREQLPFSLKSKRRRSESNHDDTSSATCSSEDGSWRPVPILPEGFSYTTSEGEDAFDAVDSRVWLDDLLTQDVAARLFEILKEKLAPEELSILMKRYADGMTYQEIVETMEDPRTPDALRMQLARLHKTILAMPEVKKLHDDYQGNS